jgi:poly(hydroxyalkanoate) granule-associated protein
MKAETRSPRNVDQVRRDLLEAGRNLWLAGLGVVAQVEEEGRGLFDRFVERGRKVEGEQFRAVDRTVSRTTETVKEWSDRVQVGLSKGMNGVLHRVGLPTQADLGHLAHRLEDLTRKVEQLKAEQLKG